MRQRRNERRNSMKLFWGCREVGDAVNEIYCVATHFHLYINEGYNNKFWRCMRGLGGAGKSVLF